MADFSQNKKYNYNWQSSKFKNLALSGSYISQFINDAGYVTSSVAISASYALTASYLTGTITSASYAVSASHALTASYFAGTVISASYATQALSASYALNGGVTQLLAGPNVTLSPTNGLGQVTVSATLSGSTIFNTATGSYGSFYDTTTQTNPIANIARSMSFNSTDITNGVSISGSTSPFNTYVKTTNAGVYDIQFSAQVDKTDGGTDDIVIWLRKNGIDLTDTATTLTLPTNNSKVVAAWNWFVSSAAGDYYQIIWRSADTDLRLLAESISVDHPGIPSVILTVNRVDQFLSNTGSFSGSFTGTFTGSLSGTASYATQALSASFAPSSPAFPYTGSAGITGSLTVVGSTNSTQIGAGAAPSGSIRLDVRAQGALSTDTVFRVRNSVDTQNLMSITGDGRVAIGLNAQILGTTDAFKNVVIGGGAKDISSAGVTENSVALGYNAVSNNGGTALGANTTIAGVSGVAVGASAYAGIDSTAIGANARADGTSLYQSLAIGKGARASALLSGIIAVGQSSYTNALGQTLAFCVDPAGANSQTMLLTNKANLIFRNSTQLTSGTHWDTTATNTLTIHSGSIPATTISGAFQMYAATGSLTNNTRPHFRTGNGTVVWLGDESRLFNVTASSIISSGSITVGNITSTPSTENTLNIYPSPAGGTGEGGQILLAASGGLYTSASMIDTYQNQFRLLKGTNTGGSTVAYIITDLQSGNTQFAGAVTASAYSGLPNSWMHALRSGNQTIGSGTWANRDIVFNDVSSNNFTYNSSTGIATLKAGKTYRITSRLAWAAAGVYVLQFRIYNQTTSAFVGPTAEIIQSTNGTNNISDGTLEHIFAVGASDVDISIRTTNITNALTGEYIRGDLNTQLIIQQIA